MIVGFAPGDVLSGVIEILEQLASGRPRVANLYTRVVRPEGNPEARAMMARWFEPVDTRWRGLGPIPPLRSGAAAGARPPRRDACGGRGRAAA